jgi:outer membrane biosynthesis protein TonB
LLQNKLYRIALAASVLIHLLILLLYMPLAGLSSLLALPKLQAPQEEPITFELTEPETLPQELVETPEDARLEAPPENAQALSDKNARAQDMYTGNDLPVGLPYSQGRSEYKTFSGTGASAAAPAAQPQPEEQRQESRESGNDTERRQFDELTAASSEVTIGYLPDANTALRRKFSKALLQSAEASPQSGAFSDDENWNNSASSAEALGGVSLSTYEWNYAPYLFYMKKRIREHLYPPQAFVQLGAISGQVTLRFILLRDGTVRDLEFINSEGHKSFIDPSLNSIRASDPFKPLPQSFPDPQLELTWTFIFTVYR